MFEGFGLEELLNPVLDGRLHPGKLPLKEMIRIFHEHQLFGLREHLVDILQIGLGTVLIVCAAHKQFWLGTALKELIGINTPFHRNRSSQRDQALHSIMGARGTQAGGRAEGEAAEENRQMELRVQPVKGCASVLNFTPALVMPAFAKSGAPKVEAQHRKAKVAYCLHGMKDNFVMHGAAKKRMRMTDQSRVGCIRLALVQQGFELAYRPGKKECLDFIRHIFLLTENLFTAKAARDAKEARASWLMPKENNFATNARE